MNFFTELKRRKVFRVAGLYAVVGWLVAQVADTFFTGLGLPAWTVTFVLALVLMGFPIALVLAWAFEVTPEGVRRTAADAASNGAPPGAGDYLLLVLLLAVIGVSTWQVLDRQRPGPFPASSVSADDQSEVDDGTPAGVTSSSVAEHSIAVLAFDNMSPDPDNAFFAEGISEEILNLLAAVESLSVASRTSAFSYRGKDMPIPDIAERLGVRYVLEGSVRKAGDQVRVTAQLIDAVSDRHLWSETFDRSLDNIFAVQDEIAGAIGDALQIELLGAGGQRITSETLDPKVYEQFLQARILVRQRNSAAIARATELLEDVVASEPGYAPGLAQLAEAYLLAGGTADDKDALQDRFNLILHQVERALAIDPDLAGAIAVRGNVAMTTDRWLDAVADFTRAAELDPGDPRPHHWLALVYSDSGHLARAEQAIARSLELDPQNANAVGWNAYLLAARGHWADALAAARSQAELGNPYGHAVRAFFQLAAKPGAGLDSAEAELRLALAKGATAAEAPLGLIAIARGDEAALETFIDDVRANRVWLYVAITGLLALDRTEAVLTLLESDDFLFNRLGPLVWSREHSALRRDPRFIEYLRRHGILKLWREIGPPPDCVEDGDAFSCGLVGGGTN